MKRFSEQFYKQAQQCKLTVSEQADLRERLTAYMEYHPLPASLKQLSVGTPSSPIGSETFHTYRLPWAAIIKGVTGLAVIILVVVPVLAERTVPGDTLYAIKVGLTEEVRSTLSFTPSQRVVWETTRLNRRIAEAQLLESKGELTQSVEADVAAAVKEHTENAQREIAVLRAVDSDEATLVELELATTLSVHSDALRSRNNTTLALESEFASTAQPSNMILSVLTDAQQGGQDITASTTLPSYEKLVARVEQHTTRLYEVLQNIEAVTPPGEFRDASRRVADIERAIAVAFTLAAEDEPTAQTALVTILQRSQRLLVYLTNLEVRSQVTLETISPIELTAEEEAALILSLTVTLNELVVNLEMTNATSTPEYEKVSFALEQIADIKETIASTSVATNPKRVISELEAGIALAKDAALLLDRYEILVPVDIPTSTATTSDTEPLEETVDSEDEVETDRPSSTPGLIEELTGESLGV